VLPAGNDISVRYGLDAAATTNIKGFIDPSTLVLRALALGAAFVTRGESVQIRAALKIELKAFLEVRRTANATTVLAEFDAKVGFFAELSRQKRAAAAGPAAAALHQVFNTLDMLWCSYKVVKDRGENGWKNLRSMFDTVVSTCWESWAGRTAAYLIALGTLATDPGTAAKMAVSMVKELVKEAKEDLTQLASAVSSTGLRDLTAGRFDYVRAGLSVTAPTVLPTLAKLKETGVCQLDCRITGTAAFQHPDWGPCVLVTVATQRAPYEQNEARILVVDASGTVRWRFDNSTWITLKPTNPWMDNTGHLFLTYNPGRYDGLVVLNPTAAGFDNYGSLPTATDEPTGAFYGGRPVDDNHDGTFEILEEINVCEPTCADGHYVATTYRWNGTDYKA
jgi:hypothetical protein